MLEPGKAAAKVQALYEQLRKRRPVVEENDRYYDGEQPLKYASDEWVKFHRHRYKGFSDNWCAVVIDALAERLKIQGFQVGSGDLSDLERTLWNDWMRNEMGAQSTQGFLQTVGSSRSAVIVWGDENDEPVSTWEHPGQVYVEYDAEFSRRRLSALKAWMDGDRELATLYTPDAVFKFERPAVNATVDNGKTASGLYVNSSSWSFASAAGWQPREVDGESWPLPNPLGVVPVVETQNRPRLARGPVSDIDGTKAMQDAINLLWAYLFGAADHASFPARVVMGNETPKLPVLDDMGRQVGEKPIDQDELRQGRMLWLTGENAKIGQWDPAKLDTFTDVIEIAISHIAAQTRTPAHYFIANKGMSNLNGETLKATETPLVKKAEDFQTYNSDPISEIFKLYAMVRGEDGLAREIGADSIQWTDLEIRSEAQRSDSLIKKQQMGYPMRRLLEMDGNSPTEVDRIMDQIKEEQAMDPLAAATEAVRQGVPNESGSAD